MHRILTSAVATGLATMFATAQSTLVVPAGYDSLEGNSANTFPFGYQGTAWAGLRLLTIYDSSHFTGASITYPILIQGLRWRANGGQVDPGGTHNTVSVELSTAAVDYTAPDTTWDNNHGPDRTVCYTGAVTRLPTSGTTPNDWFVDIQLSTSFLYDPTSGNDLVIDVDKALSWTGTGASISHDNVSGSTASPPPLACRVFGSSLYPAANGVTNDYGLVCEISYVPAAGLYAFFTSDVTTGSSPLTVNFTDNSYSSDPLGVLAWAWDFENDGTVDSTVQNPTHTFTACGSYDVKLEVFDASNPPASMVKPAYIVTDAVTADFTDSLLAPLTVLFTDTSTGSPTAWAWDLDGDGTVDSTSQSPAWVYPNTNPVNVTLTASRLCGPADTITRTIVPLQQISHNIAPNNGLSDGASVYFDVDVLNPNGLSVNSLDVFGSIVNVPFSVDLYVRQGTYTGFTGTASEWVLAGTASGTSSGATTTPSPCTFATPVYLPFGLSGIKLHYRGTGPRYQTGTAITTIANGDLSLTLGTSRGSTTTAPWSGSDITPRWWSGTIYYNTFNITGEAAYGAFGAGCAGSMPTATLTPSGDPVLGTALSVTIANLPVNAAIMMTGFSKTSWALGALPFDLGVIGAAGCMLRVSPDSNLFLVGAGNQAVWTLPIPNDPGLAGVLFFQQAAVIDPTANGAGGVGSNAHAFIIGN